MTEVVANWVPSTILAAIVLGGIGWASKKLDRLLDKIVARLEAIEGRQHEFATVEQLGRAIDRVDGRTTNNSERIAVLEALRKA